ncbi:MAG: putative signal transducing protein [Pseudomarimonas sp.]
MRAVYQAENLFDAHLVRGRLASEGVDAVVTGEYLAGAMGELPVAGLLAVWVDDDDCTAALELLAAWKAEDAESLAQAQSTDWSNDLRDEAFLA